MSKQKILGMLIGGAVGDAWGVPVETWSPERIFATYPGGLPKFTAPQHHKWFSEDKFPPGTTTDDTQLTLATLNGLIVGRNAGDYKGYMDAIAVAHRNAMRQTTAGWGHSTRDAIRRLQNGVHWSQSGHTNELNRGTGNGVPMKVSPLSMHYVFCREELDYSKWLIDFSAMTHYTQMSALATIIHFKAVSYCLENDASSFCNTEFLNELKSVFDEPLPIDHLLETKDDLRVVFDSMDELTPFLTVDEIRANFGNGSCYVYDSLPFSYAWFIKNPFSIQNLQSVVEAGGDADTNAKLVGEMMGALNGLDWLLDQAPWIKELVDYAQIIDLGLAFCETFNIQK